MIVHRVLSLVVLSLLLLPLVVAQNAAQEVSEDLLSAEERAWLRSVVYHDSAINITDIVMRHLEQQSKTSQVATDGGAAPATNR